MKKLFCIFIVFLCVAPICGFAHKMQDKLHLPNLNKNERYESVRSKLLGAGWKPYHAKDALECDATDVRCQGRPEMEACSDVGQGQCTWLWTKGGQIIAIDTLYGVDDDVFVGASSYRSH